MSGSKPERIPVLLGPTAVGKTALTRKLLQANARFRFVLADSRKIYLGLDIGTAKPPPDLRPYFRMFDLIPPDRHYSAMDYARDARRAIEEIKEEGNIPVVVGGTPLYLRALFEGLFEAPSPDPDLRRELLERYHREGPEKLHRELQEVDPEAAAHIHPHDWVRLTRALEVYYQTGVPISRLQKERRQETGLKPIYLGAFRPRPQLYERINRRVDQMMAEGLLDEVRALLFRYPPSAPGFRTIGYQELIPHLMGAYSLEEAVRRIKRNTRLYARKQLRFFRKLGKITWFDLSDPHQEAELSATLSRLAEE